MLPFDPDEDFIRPVGVSSPAGRFSIGPRQIITVLLVLLLGGALGTGAYFLSDYDARDLIGLLDIADMQGPALKLRLPGHENDEPSSGELLSPPKPDTATPAPAAAVVRKPADKPAEILAKAAPSPPPLSSGPVDVAVPAIPTARNAEAPPTLDDLPAPAEAESLAAAPVKEMTIDSPQGPLPVIAADGRQAWKVYARPFSGPAGRPRIAVVVTDLGLDRNATDAAIARLPAEVSLAFSPYSSDVEKWIKRARDAGHEALMTLPVEPPGYPASDPGPLGLLSVAAPRDNQTHLEQILAHGPGTAGVVAAASPFTMSDRMAPVLATLLQRGLLYIGDGARTGRVPAAAGVTMVIDQDPWRDAIEARLAAAEGVAKAQGAVVLLASARPVTLDRLAAWFGGFADKGLSLAPVSSVVQPPGKSG